MGKSFNNDVDFNLDSINGFNISKEAIEENKKKTTPTIDVSKINLSEAKKEMQQEAKKKENDIVELQKELDRVEKEKTTQPIKEKEQVKENEYYTKKTMIFKTDYLDIIMGLASIKNMEIKAVLNQIIELGLDKLNEKDNTLIEKARKEAKKSNTKKENNSLF